MRVLLTAASAGTRPQSNPLQQPCGPAPGAFLLNQSNMLSLPVVTDGLRVLWVHSDQARQQLVELDSVAELVEALNTFPYPTRGEMAALARRCSLQLDQVRVWFMIQRLRYGLSWDSEDICEVRQRLRCSGQTQGVGEGGQEKRGEKTSEGQGNEDSMDGEAGGEGVNVAEKRQEGGNGEGKITGQERVEIVRKKLGRSMEEAGKRRKTRCRDKKKAAKRKREKSNLKGMAQVQPLRKMIMTRLYPSSNDYNHLISQTGLSRRSISNWFCHLRYRIKNGSNPYWLTKHACHCLRRRLQYRYKMQALAKAKSVKENPPLKVKLEWERHRH